MIGLFLLLLLEKDFIFQSKSRFPNKKKSKVNKVRRRRRVRAGKGQQPWSVGGRPRHPWERDREKDVCVCRCGISAQPSNRTRKKFKRKKEKREREKKRKEHIQQANERKKTPCHKSKAAPCSTVMNDRGASDAKKTSRAFFSSSSSFFLFSVYCSRRGRNLRPFVRWTNPPFSS